MTKILLMFFLSFNLFAKDMSHDEWYKDVYKENTDGSQTYIGSCSLHQHYENKKFRVIKTLVKYFEININKYQIQKKFQGIENELIEELGGFDAIYYFDDIALEKIEHNRLKNFDLYRFNIGTGGGNGYYEIYQRFVLNNKIHYKKLAHIFDGEVEFCDSSVWKK